MNLGERERWRAEVHWHRELLEKVANDLERLALRPGRTEVDATALRCRAARIREHLFYRSREPHVPV